MMNGGNRNVKSILTWLIPATAMKKLDDVTDKIETL